VQALGMFTVIAKIVLTQGLLSTKKAPTPTAASTTSDSTVENGGTVQPPHHHSHCASTAVSDMPATQTAVKLSSAHAEHGAQHAAQRRAVRDVSLTTIHVDNSHLRSILPMEGRPLAASFVQSAARCSTWHESAFALLPPQHACQTPRFCV
jgi:hypothetical protein